MPVYDNLFDDIERKQTKEERRDMRLVEAFLATHPATYAEEQKMKKTQAQATKKSSPQVR